VPCQSWIRVEWAESASAAAGNDSISRPFIPRRVRGHRNLAQLAAGRLADRLTLPHQLATGNTQCLCPFAADAPAEKRKGNPVGGNALVQLNEKRPPVGWSKGDGG